MDYKNLVKYSYLTFLMVPHIDHTRTFIKFDTQSELDLAYKKSQENSVELKKSLTTLEIVKTIKSEYSSKYCENFIIETLMKVSGNLNDLKIYLSNPYLNKGKINKCIKPIDNPKPTILIYHN